MTDINCYMHDGANVQAQCVLAYLRAYGNEAFEHIQYEKFNPYFDVIQVGRYENTREQGYVFTIMQDGKQMHWAVYEHRNSDRLIVLKSDVFSSNTPTSSEMWSKKGENATKYDYDKDFEWMDIKGCGEWLIADMKAFVDRTSKYIGGNDKE